MVSKRYEVDGEGSDRSRHALGVRSDRRRHTEFNWHCVHCIRIPTESWMTKGNASIPCKQILNGVSRFIEKPVLSGKDFFASYTAIDYRLFARVMFPTSSSPSPSTIPLPQLGAGFADFLFLSRWDIYVYVFYAIWHWSKCMRYDVTIAHSSLSSLRIRSFQRHSRLLAS